MCNWIFLFFQKTSKEAALFIFTQKTKMRWCWFDVKWLNFWCGALIHWFMVHIWIFYYISRMSAVLRFLLVLRYIWIICKNCVCFLLCMSAQLWNPGSSELFVSEYETEFRFPFEQFLISISWCRWKTVLELCCCALDKHVHVCCFHNACWQILYQILDILIDLGCVPPKLSQLGRQLTEHQLGYKFNSSFRFTNVKSILSQLTDHEMLHAFS